MIKSAIAKLGIVAVLAGISPIVQVIVGAGLGTQSWILPITHQHNPPWLPNGEEHAMIKSAIAKLGIVAVLAGISPIVQAIAGISSIHSPDSSSLGAASGGARVFKCSKSGAIELFSGVFSVCHKFSWVKFGGVPGDGELSLFDATCKESASGYDYDCPSQKSETKKLCGGGFCGIVGWDY